MKSKIILLALIGLSVTVSCGARKTDKKKTEEVATVDYAAQFNEYFKAQEDLAAESNVKTNAVTKFNIENKAVKTVNTWEPLNPNLEASVIDAQGNKTILNNVRKTEEQSTQDKKENSEKTESSDQQYKIQIQKQEQRISELEQQLEEAAIKNSESKNVDKKAVAFLQYWWVFLILAVVLMLVFNEPILNYFKTKKAW
jgi:cobalamin biosynthesis Mg chelatase CobN